MITAYVSLGSNLGNATEYLAKARKAVAALRGISIVKESPQYRTEPQDMKEQDWFINQVLELHCTADWDPDSLMQSLLAVEASLGRSRSTDPALRYGPRCIDIDVLLFGEQCSASPICQVPHPRMHMRAFVLVPLRDIAPEVSIKGVKVKDLLHTIPYSVEGSCIRQ